MPNRTLKDQNYRFGFNGKEADREGQWGSTEHYDYGFRIYDPKLGRFLSVDPLADHPNQVGRSPYSAMWNNPIKYIDPDGRCPDCPTLYHNTGNARGIVEGGFNATQHGKFSNYNWFSTTANAPTTGRAGQGTTLGVGMDVSNAHTITKAQTTAWRLEARSELGYSKESLKALQASDSKAYGKAMSQINGSMYSKVGAYMDDMGKGVYHLAKDGTYAVTDALANQGTIKTIQGSSASLKALKGLKVGGRALGLVAVGLDLYEIHSSGYEPRTITRVAGGWGGTWAGSSMAASAYTATGLDLTGPWGWVGHGVVTIGGGIGGYFLGREVSETVYDYVTSPGIKPGGN